MAQNETQAGAAVAAARTLLGLTNGATGAMAVLERCAGGTAEELQAAAAAAVQTARATAKAAVSAARYAASFDEIERLPEPKSDTAGSSGSGSSGSKKSSSSSGGLSSSQLKALTREVLALRQTLTTLWDEMTRALGPAAALWTLFWNTVNQAATIVWSVVRPILEGIYNTWFNVMTALWQLWATYGQPVMDMVMAGWGMMGQGLLNLWTSIVQPILANIGLGFQTLWDEVLNPLWQKALLITWQVSMAVKQLWDTVLQPLLTWLADTFASAWAVVMQGVGTASQQATQVIQGAVLLTRQTMDGILLFVSQVFAGNWAAAWDTIRATVETVWSGIQNTVRGAVNVMIGFVNTLIRAFVTGVNGIIDGLNTLDVTVPDWVPLLGGKHFGVSLSRVSAPQIPLLASGGVIRQPTLAMMGEYAGAGSDPEIAAPQSAIGEAVAAANGDVVDAVLTAAQQIIDAIRENGGGVVLSDAVIGRAVRRYNSRQAVITGGAGY